MSFPNEPNAAPSFRRPLQQAAILALLALVPAALAALFHPQRPPFSWTASPDPYAVALAAAQAQPDALWIDARPRADYEREHIPGALLLNEDEWDLLFPEFLAQWRPGLTTVVYCSSQQCGSSRQVAERLRREVGDESFFWLEGGWEAWIAARP